MNLCQKILIKLANVLSNSSDYLVQIFLFITPVPLLVGQQVNPLIFHSIVLLHSKDTSFMFLLFSASISACSKIMQQEKTPKGPHGPLWSRFYLVGDPVK